MTSLLIMNRDHGIFRCTKHHSKVFSNAVVRGFEVGPSLQVCVSMIFVKKIGIIFEIKLYIQSNKIQGLICKILHIPLI
jgi:hypothetical protein